MRAHPGARTEPGIGSGPDDETDSGVGGYRGAVLGTTAQGTARAGHPPVTDPLDGLGKFDLGTVPASVTPPRSWRRAAWFAVISSMGVVVAMMLATASFVNSGDSGSRTIDALPNGYANNKFPEALRQPGNESSSRESAADSTGRDQTTSSRTGPQETRSFGGDTRSEPAAGTAAPDTSDSTPAAPGAPGTGQPSDPAPTTGSPSRSRNRPPAPEPEVEVARGFHMADPDKMAKTTRDYYYYVTENPQEAYALTTGSSTSPGEIKRRYASVRYILIRKIRVHPDRPETVNTVEITHTDGRTVTERRELQYSYGFDPKVTADS